MVGAIGDWDWETIRDALLVVGPLVAAGVVVWSAVFARRAAEAAERTAAASVTPLLVDVPYGEALSPEEQVLFPDGKVGASVLRGAVLLSIEVVQPDRSCRLSLPLRNIGRGVAVIEYAEMYVWRPDPRSVTSGGPSPGFYYVLQGRAPRITNRQLPAGEETRVSFAFEGEETDANLGFRFGWESSEYGLAVLVEYWDLGYVKQHRALARLWRHPTETRWYVQDLITDPPFDAGPHSLSRLRADRPPWQG